MLFELRCKGFGLFAGCLRRQPQAKSLPGARQHSTLEPDAEAPSDIAFKVGQMP